MRRLFGIVTAVCLALAPNLKVYAFSAAENEPLLEEIAFFAEGNPTDIEEKAADEPIDDNQPEAEEVPAEIPDEIPDEIPSQPEIGALQEEPDLFASKRAYWLNRQILAPDDLDLGDFTAEPAPVAPFPEENFYNEDSAVGANIAAPAPDSREWIFLDAFKASGGWYSQFKDEWDVWDDSANRPLDLDETGWVRSLDPNQIAAAYLLADKGYSPTGRYIVRYEGSGTIEYGLGARKIEESSGPGRDVVDYFDSNQGMLLRITQTDPHDYLREIRVYRPGTEELGESGEIFHPAFLDNLKYFKTLRFAEALAVHRYPLGLVKTHEPESRPQVDRARWSADAGGLPFEIAILLSQRVNANAWVNMPYAVSDAYIRELALVSHALMKESQKILYVEYGNEVWNFSRPNDIGGSWVEQQALKRWSSTGTHPYPGYDETDRIRGRMNFYAMRTTQICKLWKDAWGEDAGRVKCVMGGQSGWNEISEEALECRMLVAENPAKNEPCGNQVDVYSTAPYFYYLPGAIATRLMMDEPDGGFERYFSAIEDILSRRDPDSLYGAIKADADLAERFNLEFIAYEGGQHLNWYAPYNNDPSLVDFLNRVNRHPRMYSVYRNYLNLWKRAGGGEIVLYKTVSRSNEDGSWGLKEYQTQSESPKSDAVLDFIHENPPWWE